MTTARLSFSLLPDRLAICRLDPHAQTPDWATAPGPFASWTRTEDELSVVCLEERVPEGVRSDRGWRALKLEGPLELTLTGIIASMAAPLAEAGIPIFMVATYDTDYLLVRDGQLEPAIAALRDGGHTVRAGD